MAKTNEKKEEKKEKKERKFNGERIERMVRKSIKEIFPNETFYISYFTDRVEVLYPSTSKITDSEIKVFTTMFCVLTKIKKEELIISACEKKATEKKAA